MNGPKQGITFTERVTDYTDELISLELMASRPYALFVHGSVEEAEHVDRTLLASGVAEFGPPFARMLLTGNRPVALLVVLSSTDLLRARLNSAMALRRNGIIAPGSDREAAVRAASSTLAQVHPEDLYLSRLAVAPDVRGRRMGSELLAEVERMALLRGFRRIILEVAPDNTAAVSLYETAGFVRGELHAAAYGDRRLEYLHMAKTVESLS